MTQKGAALAVTAALVAGFLGYQLGASQRPRRIQTGPSVTAPALSSANAPRSEDAPRSTFAVPPSPEKCATSGQQATALESENSRLNEEVARLTQRLAENEANRAQLDGVPLAAPAELDERRYNEAALARVLERGLRAAGLPDAAVTSVDCTEYPCIVYGQGAELSPDVWRQLLQTEALKEYAGHGAYLYGLGDTHLADGGSQPNFGVALVPQPDKEQRQAAIEKRLSYRVRLMRE